MNRLENDDAAVLERIGGLCTIEFVNGWLIDDSFALSMILHVNVQHSG
jgi:hypothetical protein